MAQSSSLAVAANIFAAPIEAFAAIKERPNVLLPLLAVLCAQTAISFVYMNSVDLAWFMDVQLQSSTEVPEAERERAVAQAASVSPMVYGALGAASSALFMLVLFFVVGLYYTGISFATNDGIKLKQWFAFACWCALPVVLGLVASLVNILANDARFMLQEEINPFSFGNLLSIDTTGAPVFQRILVGLDLTTVWSLVLAAFGYQAWTGRSLTASVVIVLGPLAAFAAIGTLITVL